MIPLSNAAGIPNELYVCNSWQRSINYTGQQKVDIIIINSLVIPKLIYLLCIFPDPPLSFFSELQKILFQFLWSNRKDNIRRSLLYSEYKEGGLKMPHLLSFNRAMKVTWIKRYFDEGNTSKWNMFFSHYLRHIGGDTGVILYYNPIKFKENISQRPYLNSHILIAGKFCIWHNMSKIFCTLMGLLCLWFKSEVEWTFCQVHLCYTSQFFPALLSTLVGNYSEIWTF